MIITFLLSAAAHELVMVIVTHKIRWVSLSSSPIPIGLGDRQGCVGDLWLTIVRSALQTLSLPYAALPDSADTGLAATGDQTEQASGERGVLGWAVRWVSVALRRICGVLSDRVGVGGLTIVNVTVRKNVLVVYYRWKATYADHLSRNVLS